MVVLFSMFVVRACAVRLSLIQFVVFATLACAAMPRKAGSTYARRVRIPDKRRKSSQRAMATGSSASRKSTTSSHPGCDVKTDFTEEEYDALTVGSSNRITRTEPVDYSILLPWASVYGSYPAYDRAQSNIRFGARSCDC